MKGPGVLRRLEHHRIPSLLFLIILRALDMTQTGIGLRFGIHDANPLVTGQGVDGLILLNITLIFVAAAMLLIAHLLRPFPYSRERQIAAEAVLYVFIGWSLYVVFVNNPLQLAP